MGGKRLGAQRAGEREQHLQRPCGERNRWRLKGLKGLHNLSIQSEEGSGQKQEQNH